MESYRSRIESALTEQGLTLKDLVNHLRLPEYEIFEGLENQTHQQRTIMAMAKFLRVPLYSFFYPQDLVIKFPSQNLSHLVDTWNDGEPTSPGKLQEDIEFLEQLLGYKKDLLNKYYAKGTM